MPACGGALNRVLIDPSVCHRRTDAEVSAIRRRRLLLPETRVVAAGNGAIASRSARKLGLHIPRDILFGNRAAP